MRYITPISHAIEHEWGELEGTGAHIGFGERRHYSRANTFCAIGKFDSFVTSSEAVKLYSSCLSHLLWSPGQSMPRAEVALLPGLPPLRNLLIGLVQLIEPPQL